MTAPGTPPPRRKRLPALLAILALAAALTGLLITIRMTRESSPSTVAGAPVSSSPVPSPSPTPRPGPSSHSSAPGTIGGLPVVDAADFGADGGDRSDDTQAIEAALRAASQRGAVLYFSEGTYAVGPIRIPDGSRLAGAGAAAWLRGPLELGGDCHVQDLKLGIDGRAFRFAPGAGHSTLLRVEFVGGGGMDSGEDQGVIRFGAGRSASFITFRECLIGTNTSGGNGVSIVDNGWEGGTYHHITWQGCTFAGSPRMTLECIQRDDGVHPLTTGYHHIDILDCVFRPSGSETVSFDAEGVAGDCRIAGCTFEGAGWNRAFPWGQGIEFNRVRDMVFERNTVYRCRGAMINHSGDPGVRTGTRMRDNVFDATRSGIDQVPDRETQVIYFNQISGARFTGNTLITNVGGELMYVSGSSDNLFDRNDFRDTRASGSAFACVKLTAGSTGNRFVSSVFRTQAPTGAVVVLDGSTGTTIATSEFVTAGARAVTAVPADSVREIGNVYR